MSNHFILAAEPGKIGNLHDETPLKVNIALFAGSNPRNGDHVLLALERNGSYDAIEPAVFAVRGVSKKNVTLESLQTYLNRVAFDKTRPLLNRGLANGANSLTDGEFQNIQLMLGTPVISEMQLLDHIKEYISARGYYFDDETIHNYHICLKTRPFVILAGLSGTGKSKLSQLYAEAMATRSRTAVTSVWLCDRVGMMTAIYGLFK